MLPFDDALNIVLNSAHKLDKEVVTLKDSMGRILYDDVNSDIDMPPFDKSAMDGYACKKEDRDKLLRIIETIPAGYTPQKTVKSGECSKIMTGGVVPKGADCVVMVEHTKSKDEVVTINKKTESPNICYQAEDVKKDDIVLKKGTCITPAEIATLASVGCYQVNVSCQPVIGIIATGSELVEPQIKPSQAQIRNSNSYQLYSQIESAGCKALYFGIVKDTPDAIREVIEKEISKVTIFLLSGGVSMGDFDFVPQVLKEQGFDLLFQKVAIKPGKPTVFGKKDNTYVFGLPGNPVSTFITFELFVKPFCFKLMGGEYKPIKIFGKLKNKIKRKKAKRLAHIPVNLNLKGEIEQIKYHGSGHTHALISANGFITMAVCVSEIAANEYVQVTLLK